MPELKITPSSVLLTSGQAVTFHATLNGNPQDVTWGVSPPQSGTLGLPQTTTPPADAKANSITYIAPQLLPAPQTVAITATTDKESASATVWLSPDAMAILPTKADLRPGESQEFFAVRAGAGDPTDVGPEAIRGYANPNIGTFKHIVEDPPRFVYTAPDTIAETTTVNLTVTSAFGRQATAVIALHPPLWTTSGVQWLGAYLLVVFTVIFLIVGLWPPALPTPEIARANRIEAERDLDNAVSALRAARINAAQRRAPGMSSANAQNAAGSKAAGAAKKPENSTNTGSKTTGPKSAADNTSAGKSAATQAASQPNTPDADSAGTTNTGGRTASVPADSDTGCVGCDDDAVGRALDQRRFAAEYLEQKREEERLATSAYVTTHAFGRLHREIDLLWLVLLAGALGSFLHMAQSYADFVGNRTIKQSWVWWYVLRPFVGAALALLFYAAVRGGIMAVATGTNAKASELNPFGVVAVAALAGMFSKAAATKLGEVFDTLFKSDKAKESKDKLNPAAEATTPTQPAKPTPGTTAGGTATK